jgi:hypothetical protein
VPIYLVGLRRSLVSINGKEERNEQQALPLNGKDHPEQPTGANGHEPGTSTAKSSPRRAHHGGDAPPDPDEAELALAFYNEQAENARPRWLLCPELTPSIRERLRQRLKHIKGLQNFKRAVLAVQHDEWMSGRKAGSNGKKFKLDIHYLLSDKRRDILVHLLGLAAHAAVTDESADDAQAKQDAMLEEIKRQQALDDERDRMERGE